MPAAPIGPTPFPLKLVDSDKSISDIEIERLVSNSEGCSLCVRALEGDNNRGGYFFHIKKTDSQFGIYDFNGVWIANVTLAFLARFINHASGRIFDPEVLVFCQTIVNLKQD